MTSRGSILWRLACERAASNKLLNIVVLVVIASFFTEGSFGWWIHLTIASFEGVLLLLEQPLRRLTPLSAPPPFP